MHVNQTRQMSIFGYDMSQRNTDVLRLESEKPQRISRQGFSVALWMSAMIFSKNSNIIHVPLSLPKLYAKQWKSINNTQNFNVNLVEITPEVWYDKCATERYVFFVFKFVEQLYTAIIKFVALAKTFLSVARKTNSVRATLILNQIESLRCSSTLTTLITSKGEALPMTTPIVHSPTPKIELTLRQDSDGDIVAALQPFLDLGMSLPYALKALVRTSMAQAEIAKMAIRAANRDQDIEAFNASVDEYNAEIEADNGLIDQWFSDEAEAV